MVPRNMHIRTPSFTFRYRSRTSPASSTGSALVISSLNPITSAGKKPILPLMCSESLTLIVTTFIQARVHTTIPAPAHISCLPTRPGRISSQKPMIHSGATYRLYAQPGVDSLLDELSVARKISGSSA